jgi:hypothetical protein
MLSLGPADDFVVAASLDSQRPLAFGLDRTTSKQTASDASACPLNVNRSCPLEMPKAAPGTNAVGAKTGPFAAVQALSGAQSIASREMNINLRVCAR